MLKPARALVTLLVLAALAGSAAPLCRCLPEPAAAPSARGGHDCCAPRTAAAWRATACCPVAPEALTNAPTPAAAPALAGATPALAPQLPVFVAPAAASLAPSPPAPPRSCSILRV